MGGGGGKRRIKKKSGFFFAKNPYFAKIPLSFFLFFPFLREREKGGRKKKKKKKRKGAKQQKNNTYQLVKPLLETIPVVQVRERLPPVPVARPCGDRRRLVGRRTVRIEDVATAVAVAPPHEQGRLAVVMVALVLLARARRRRRVSGGSRGPSITTLRGPGGFGGKRRLHCDARAHHHHRRHVSNVSSVSGSSFSCCPCCWCFIS